MNKIPQNFIEINPENIDLSLDIRYATVNNVCKKKLYKNPQALLHQEAYSKLLKAVGIAKNLNLKLKIFDCYRPFAVQKTMYQHFANDPSYQSFFSNPESGSTPHCRGVAVDLTLVDNNEKELDMGCDFDELSPLAFHNNCEISLQARYNRNILLSIMTLAGFDFYSKEWWHYQLFNPRNYEIIDFTI